MRLEELETGQRIEGLISAQVVAVLSVLRHGTEAVELTYKTTAGALGQQIVFRKDQDALRPAGAGGRPVDANASDFKLAAEAQRIRLAGLFDPMLAVATSDVQPLPFDGRLSSARH